MLHDKEKILRGSKVLLVDDDMRNIFALTNLLEDRGVEALELRLLQEAIFLKYGYDFRNYSDASFKRRVHLRMGSSGLSTVSEAIHRLLYDPDFFDIR